ncbi:hypothetical protein UZ36_07955, partial [Candidatus Nitromaritima sp. SCGC AAA799-C22]
WRDRGLEVPVVAVNLSVQQVLNPGLVACLDRFLVAYDLEPNQLELEITESVLASDFSMVGRILEQLHWLGFNLVIDDFGTGFSSLKHLSIFPVSALKIDRFFVQDLEVRKNLILVKNMLQLAAQLNLESVVEGVETEKQLQTLRFLGCRKIQGNFFAPPLEPGRVEPYLRKGFSFLLV